MFGDEVSMKCVRNIFYACFCFSIDVYSITHLRYVPCLKGEVPDVKKVKPSLVGL
jgi:hypothetical protein